ncbi:MAG: TlyA family RNA methyltransferase [Candidatus Omnitrophica bacterium]|nr:TlyA family RNA methyltransferase [Candidatus Omnitrophota bacterium]
MEKIRLDQLLVDKKLTDNRNEAQRLIRAGVVLVREEVSDKPGVKVAKDAPIRLLKPESPYVSRGGLKLEGALKRFGIDPSGCIAADLGASTGGFTDCLLKHGARKVYAMDVGYGQLAYSLQIDPRVVVMDRTNTRYLTREDLGEAVDIVVADLSFISIRTVFPAIQRIIKEDGIAILLIKPQFEIGKGRVGKKGIVRKADDHAEVLEDCVLFLSQKGWRTVGIAPSPITGKSGNIEFLLYGAPSGSETLTSDAIRSIVQESHSHANPDKKSNESDQTQ